MEHRIQFLRDSKGQAIGCLAIKAESNVGRNGGYTTITYQMSVLNPLDKFDRKMARQLALGRLVESPISLTMRDSTPHRKAITQLVMENIKNDPLAPTRARKAANLWLREDKLLKHRATHR